MYCANCGKQIDDKAVVCVHCGMQVKSLMPKAEDRPNFGFALLGFFLPLVGLILYLVYQDTFPMRAKSAGKGALWGVIVSVILTILLVVLYVLGISYLFSALYDYSDFDDAIYYGLRGIQKIF